MDMFEKATKAVREVGESVIDSAKNLGASVYCTSKVQGELAGMKVQKSVIEKRLDGAYAVIGRRYVEYMNGFGNEAFDISDVLESMQPDLEKLNEINLGLIEKEEAAKKEEEERRQKKALHEFEMQKAKLDKALELDIVTVEEYNTKLEIIQKKYDNYEQLRKYELQFEMGIISKDEHELKINELLNN